LGAPWGSLVEPWRPLGVLGGALEASGDPRGAEGGAQGTQGEPKGEPRGPKGRSSGSPMSQNARGVIKIEGFKGGGCNLRDARAHPHIHIYTCTHSVLPPATTTPPPDQLPNARAHMRPPTAISNESLSLPNISHQPQYSTMSPPPELPTTPSPSTYPSAPISSLGFTHNRKNNRRRF